MKLFQDRHATFARSLLATLMLLLSHGAASGGVYPDTPTRLWPNGIIPYQFDSDASININQRLVVLAAMNAWAAAANVTFVFRTNSEPDYLFLRQGTTGPSYPPPEGYRAGTGQHILNLNFWGTNNNSFASCTTVFGMAHEIGHALGLLHTHQSPSRNNYFNIRTNVIGSGLGNFTIAANSLQWPRSVPDIDSIMSYPLCTFSTCSNCSANIQACAPILLLEPYATQWAAALTCGGQCPPPVQCVGQRNHLSVWDQAVMSYLYPQSNWRFVEAGATNAFQDGSFHYPVKTFLTAKTFVPSGGTLFMEPDTYSNSGGVHTKHMTVRATLAPGSAFIRN
ncbi:MAG TPA: M12 family metallopeptidase [Candidatus Acidoferrum sp.]|nr:M12 family metallopeptidase [Candidatus Acidoferrum sp.]